MPPADDDLPDPALDHSPIGGGGKTFLKPFVKGVASAGRSVGAGIYHAGKVVDAITEFRIFLSFMYHLLDWSTNLI
jgi:hypothetical protein